MVTSQDFSWLQNGQLNCLSSGSLFFLGSAFRLDLLLPITMLSYNRPSKQSLVALGSLAHFEAETTWLRLIPGIKRERNKKKKSKKKKEKKKQDKEKDKKKIPRCHI